MTNRKVALVILDGWGIGAGDRTDAIAQARTPFIDGLRATVPHATLRTDGLHVGLPDGQMGNSEVGHLNIGAGRVVYQDLVRVDKAIEDGSLEKNEELQRAFTAAKTSGKRLHFMGLVSKGGVHSMQSHLPALCQMAKRAGVPLVLVHAATGERKFNAILATSSINDAIEYFEVFKQAQAERMEAFPDHDPLKIAAVFSPPPKALRDDPKTQTLMVRPTSSNSKKISLRRARTTRLIPKPRKRPS